MEHSYHRAYPLFNYYDFNAVAMLDTIQREFYNGNTEWAVHATAGLFKITTLFAYDALLYDRFIKTDEGVWLFITLH